MPAVRLIQRTWLVGLLQGRAGGVRIPGFSRRKAIALLADEIGLIEETARTMDKRARVELGLVQSEPKKSKPPETTPKIIESRRFQGGGYRENAGRKPKEREQLFIFFVFF